MVYSFEATVSMPMLISGTPGGYSADMNNGEIINVKDPPGATSAANKQYVDKYSPVGSIVMWGGTSAPTGWLLCDGAVYNKADYPLLEFTIGTAYGGTAGTTFAVPDLEARFPRGGTTGTNRQGGSDTLVSANLPPHSHTLSSGTVSSNGAHDHSINFSVSTGSAIGNVPKGQAATDQAAVQPINDNADHSHTLSGSTGNGPGTSTAFHPAYTHVRFIIRATP